MSNFLDEWDSLEGDEDEIVERLEQKKKDKDAARQKKQSMVIRENKNDSPEIANN